MLMRGKLAVALFLLITALAIVAPAEPKVGGSPEPFTLKTMAGQPLSLADHLGKEVVILSFFTSWSKSGRQELAFLNGLAQQYRNKGLKIIGVSYDRKLAELQAYLNEEKLIFDVVPDRRLTTLKDYRILILPTLFLVDRQGNISQIFVDFDGNVAKAVSRRVEELLVP